MCTTAVQEPAAEADGVGCAGAASYAELALPSLASMWCWAVSVLRNAAGEGPVLILLVCCINTCLDTGAA